MNKHKFLDHPLYHANHWHITTPEMEKLKETVHRWLWTGSTGGLIRGQARLGKTTAIEWLQDKITNRVGQVIPTFTVSIPERDVKTIRSVYRHLMLTTDLPLKRYEVADVMRNDYVTMLIETCMDQKINNCILFVDEAQRLNIQQYNVFAELYDLMRQAKLSLSVFFVANSSEIDDTVTALKDRCNRHIRGRFFIEQTDFFGLRDQSDIRCCLKQYDSLTYPETGPTYTQHFLPDAFGNGWRLEELTELLWDSFTRIKTLADVNTWPMTYFIKTVNMLLIDWLPRYGIENVSQELINRCVNDSGLAFYNIETEETKKDV